ncbi:MAG: transcription antitermination factor NusB [Caulobacteraceae bacterium]|nr:transcription antitermination factor NusB [Caulobacteraceae bacterium]
MTAPSKKSHQSRSVARLGAVQALYQMEASGIGSEAVIREFVDHRFGNELEGEALAPADEAYFTDIVHWAVERQADVDRAVAKRLAEGWRLERLDATLRAILRAGAAELLRGEAPIEVVINEYVEIAKSFFEGPEPGFVNGALDAIAHDVRA